MSSKQAKPRRSTGSARRSASRKISPAEQAAKLAAIDSVQARIELAMDGTILYANQNFLNAMG